MSSTIFCSRFLVYCLDSSTVYSCSQWYNPYCAVLCVLFVLSRVVLHCAGQCFVVPGCAVVCRVVRSYALFYPKMTHCDVLYCIATYCDVQARRDGARWGSGYVAIAEYGGEYLQTEQGMEGTETRAAPVQRD